MKLPRLFYILTEGHYGAVWRWRDRHDWGFRHVYYDGDHWMLCLGPLTLSLSH